MTIHEKLVKIQTELKAPKNQFNAFGKYKYRSLEDIYEGLKPLLAKYNCHVTIDNKLMFLNDYEVNGQKGMIFRESIAKLTCGENPDQAVSVTTFTQEEFNKKGMSPAQCSGSTASYSDKYALNKLFCIDDNKDADTFSPSDNQKQTQQQAPRKQQSKSKKLSEKQMKRFYALANKAGSKIEDLKAYAQKQGFEKLEDMTKSLYDVMCEGFEKKIAESENAQK